MKKMLSSLALIGAMFLAGCGDCSSCCCKHKKQHSHAPADTTKKADATTTKSSTTTTDKQSTTATSSDVKTTSTESTDAKATETK